MEALPLAARKIALASGVSASKLKFNLKLGVEVTEAIKSAGGAA